MIRNTLPSNTIFNLHIKINKYKRRGLKLQKENKELLKVVYA